MADAGVTGVAAKLGELAAAEATALLRVDVEIRSLRRKLAYLQALVRGADRARRGRANELLLLWLRETREVAFEVEDAVDDFHLRVEAFHLSAKGRRGWWRSAAFNLVQGLATQIVVRHGLSNQIGKINERIDELNQNKETYAIESFPSETWNSSSIVTDPEWYLVLAVFASALPLRLWICRICFFWFIPCLGPRLTFAGLQVFVLGTTAHRLPVEEEEEAAREMVREEEEGIPSGSPVSFSFAAPCCHRLLRRWPRLPPLHLHLRAKLALKFPNGDMVLLAGDKPTLFVSVFTNPWFISISEHVNRLWCLTKKIQEMEQFQHRFSCLSEVDSVFGTRQWR